MAEVVVIASGEIDGVDQQLVELPVETTGLVASIDQAEALLDPAGLGSFVVAEWRSPDPAASSS